MLLSPVLGLLWRCLWRWPMMWASQRRAVVSSVGERLNEQSLIGLKHYVETGEEIRKSVPMRHGAPLSLGSSQNRWKTNGAGDGDRTHGLLLGKQKLYH